jgi:hypothetical protein
MLLYFSVSVIFQTQEYGVRFEIFMAVTVKNASSGMLCHMALVRTDILEEHSASFAACVGCQLWLTLFLVH